MQGPFPTTRSRVSPDSRWLAYTLELPSGLEAFAQPFDRSGDRIQVSARGGFGPVWRDDGRELYYEGPAGLMAVPMTERDGTLEAGTPQVLFAIHSQGNVAARRRRRAARRGTCRVRCGTRRAHIAPETSYRFRRFRGVDLCRHDDVLGK